MLSQFVKPGIRGQLDTFRVYLKRVEPKKPRAHKAYDPVLILYKDDFNLVDVNVKLSFIFSLFTD